MGYELLTGKLPLGRFPEPSAVRTDIPAQLSQLLLALLDPDPAQRPAARLAQERAIFPANQAPVKRGLRALLRAVGLGR